MSFFFANLFRTRRWSSPASQPQYVCFHQWCDFICGNEAHLREHYETHHVDARLSLEQSENVTTHGSHSHDSTHAIDSINNPPSVTAESTSIEFRQWTPTNHLKKSSPRHIPSNRQFPCDYCLASFDRSSDCQRHMNSHDEAPGKDRHDCLVAGCPRKGINGFARTDNLKTHVSARHPLDDFNRFLQTPRIPYRCFGSRECLRTFVLWQREKHLWQTQHPSAEIPPLLSTETFFMGVYNCPNCRFHSWYERDVEDHMRSQHPFVHLPFWMQREHVYSNTEIDDKKMIEMLNSEPSVPVAEYSHASNPFLG